MKMFKYMAAQGDILIMAVDAIPTNTIERQPRDGHYVLAHSETGHQHIVDAKNAQFWESPNPLVCFLKIDGEYADLVHQRSFDTHETIRIPAGNYQIRRQREWSPAGWRRVKD